MCFFFVKMKQLTLFIFHCMLVAARFPIHCRGNNPFCLSVTAGCQITRNVTYTWSASENSLFYSIVLAIEFDNGVIAANHIRAAFELAQNQGLLGNCFFVRSRGGIHAKYLKWKKVADALD